MKRPPTWTNLPFPVQQNFMDECGISTINVSTHAELQEYYEQMEDVDLDAVVKNIIKEQKNITNQLEIFLAS